MASAYSCGPCCSFHLSAAVNTKMQLSRLATRVHPFMKWCVRVAISTQYSFYVKYIYNCFFYELFFLLSETYWWSPWQHQAMPSLCWPQYMLTRLYMQKHVSSMRTCATDEQCLHLHRSKSTGAVDQVPRIQQEQTSGDVSVAALIRACGYPAGALAVPRWHSMNCMQQLC